MASPASYSEAVEPALLYPNRYAPSIHVLDKLKTMNEGEWKSWVTALLGSDMFAVKGRGYFPTHLYSVYHRMRLEWHTGKKACSVLQLVIYLGSGLDHHPYLCLSKQNRRYLKYDDRKRQVPSEAAGPHTIHGGKGSVSFLRSSGHWIKWLGLRQTAGSHIRELLTGWGNFIPRTFFHSAYKFTNHLLCPQHYASFLE